MTTSHSAHQAASAALKDPSAGAIIASQWTLPSAGAVQAAGRAALDAMPATPGLSRFSVYSGDEDSTLFLLSQWRNEASRDAWTRNGTATRQSVDDAVPGIRRDWRHLASPYRRFVVRAEGEPQCLVVVHQPLDYPDARVQRQWADVVVVALESDDRPIPGLHAATFFPTDDGTGVLNLAEWADADSHRSALLAGEVGPHGNLGGSPAWRATRAVAGVAADHAVRRYSIIGAVEPAARAGL